MKQENLKGRIARWAMQLQGYKFSVSHRRGQDNVVPDALFCMYADEIAAIESYGSEIDLGSSCFKNAEY